MTYKSYIYIFNWKTKIKKCKTVLSKHIKFKIVIIWFEYLLEFNEVSFCFHMIREWIPNMKNLRLSNFYHHIWLFYEHLLVYCLVCVLAVLFYEILLPWKQDLGYAESENLEPQCTNMFFTSLCTCLIYQEEFTIKIIVQNSKRPRLNLFTFPKRLGWAKMPY